MITEYQRPDTIEDALALLVRAESTLPLGGGILLNAPHSSAFAVVDLQKLSLDSIRARGRFLDIGATATLQQLADSPGLPAALRKAIEQEATRNLRHQASIAGTLIAADGRSPLACVMLALDAQVMLLPGDETVDYGQLLHMRSVLEPDLPCLPGRLATGVTILPELGLAYESVGRSPADRPIVTVAAAAWPSGRLRIAIGGWGRHPRLALDAPEPGGFAVAVASAAGEAGDEWASAEYRRETAVELAGRAVIHATGLTTS